MQRPLKKYVFAFLVVTALGGAGFLAGSTAVPEPVPDYSLQAAEIHRLEVGAAFFVAFYLAAMAFLLALDGRGFAEFGARGLKADAVVRHSSKQEEARIRQMRLDQQRDRRLKGMRADVADLRKAVKSQQRRLERLEANR